ncbi:hypothetical protein WR25_01370 [Diploscapter pachys]|uniref:cytidine deaminase n=1 Tax=Diploscapter pachys TaxID=2018661 RepID=A0A2A2KV43_9BILA|nr:hypothetical protein WR25_01370 [Diploscapter pachys]
MPVVYAKRITADDLTQEIQVEFVGERHCSLSATDLSFIVGERQFGRGRFSGVFKAELVKPDRMTIAIKMVLVSAEVRTIPAGEVQLPVEIVILGKLRCPFIVSAFYYFTRQVASDVSLSLLKNSTYSFHPIPFKLFYCVILNAMPSDMEKLTRNDKVWLDRVDATMYSWQLLRAIEHLEQKAVIHLDIKPSNILVNHEEGILQLADFGNAYFFDEVPQITTGYQVTRYYRPPELLLGGKQISSACDAWSVACVIYEFFTSKQLFKARDKNGQATPLQVPLILQVFGYPTEEDIKAMNVKRPRYKSCEGRGLGRFVAGAIDDTVLSLLQSILLYNPGKRAKPSVCLQHSTFDLLRSVRVSANSKQRPADHIGQELREMMQLANSQSEKIIKKEAMTVDDEQLLQKAKEVMKHAYIPYSKFPVGAALLTEDDQIIVGGKWILKKSNVCSQLLANHENASYGGTICAERSAMCAALSQGHRKFKAIAVATELPEPASPCGICRQFLIEFGNYPVILGSTTSNNVKKMQLKELLPLAFTPADLDEHSEMTKEK